MISVVIPTLEAAATLPSCLSALVPAALDGLVGEVIVADAGSRDDTRRIADDAGCNVVDCPVPGRGIQLREGAAVARHPWLLFLHADTTLAPGWQSEARALIDDVASGRQPPVAAAFRLALDDERMAARLLEVGVALRCRLLKLPFGDQGLLIPRTLYDSVGGYPSVRLMEDVALVRSIPRRARIMLRAKARTSASRYRTDGYTRRVLTNWTCLALYTAGVPLATIERLYRGSKRDRG